MAVASFPAIVTCTGALRVSDSLGKKRTYLFQDATKFKSRLASEHTRGGRHTLGGVESGSDEVNSSVMVSPMCASAGRALLDLMDTATSCGGVRLRKWHAHETHNLMPRSVVTACCEQKPSSPMCVRGAGVIVMKCRAHSTTNLCSFSTAPTSGGATTSANDVVTMTMPLS